MRRSRWLWRWRRNPLRRRSYLVEAWALPAVALAAAAGAALTAFAVTATVHDHLAQQRRDRHPVPAVLTERTPPAERYATGSRAVVRWTAADGTRHTATARVASNLPAGARVTIWTDGRNHVLAAPLSPARARADAAAGGVAAGAGVAVCAAAAVGLARRAADRRRAQCWATEWSVVGPRWDRRNA